MRSIYILPIHLWDKGDDQGWEASTARLYQTWAVQPGIENQGTWVRGRHDGRWRRALVMGNTLVRLGGLEHLGGG